MGAGKFLGAYFAASLGSSTQKIAKYIGRVLLVQAGMSIALVIVIGKDDAFAAFSEQFIATLLTCVVATELLVRSLFQSLLIMQKKASKTELV